MHAEGLTHRPRPAAELSVNWPVAPASQEIVYHVPVTSVSSGTSVTSRLLYTSLMPKSQSGVVSELGLGKATLRSDWIQSRGNPTSLKTM